MQRGPSFTGMLVRGWKKGSSHKPGRIWLRFRKIMRKLGWRLHRQKEKKKYDDLFSVIIVQELLNLI